MRSRLSSLASTLLLAQGAAGCGSLLGLDEFTASGDGGASSSGNAASTSEASSSTETGSSSSGDAVSSSSAGGGDGGATSSSGSGGQGGAGGSGGAGGGAECTDPVQCPEPDEDCRVAVCENEACGVAVAEDGEPCDGGTCLDGACDVAPGCQNGRIDGNETDVDCGGSCPNCADGLNCDVGGDCVSGYCPNGDDCARCTTHAQCGDGRWCDDAEGICRDDKGDGAPCDEGDECGSGNCPGDDGVCCDVPCSGPCESCGDGSCDLIELGSDPDDECEQTDCTTGVCGGDGRCEVEPEGTICGPNATCADSVQTLSDTCNDSGVCVDNGTVDCGNYACNGAVCRTTCVNDGQCADGFNCYSPDCEVPICAEPPCVLDARGYGGPLDTTATGVAVDPVSLDAFVVGSFSGLLATGGPTSSGSTVDAYFARFSSTNGALVYGRALGGTGTQRGGEVVRIQNGNFAISGSFDTGIDLDGVAGNELTPDGAAFTAGFVAQYDTNGTHLGAFQFGDVSPPGLPAPAITSPGLGDDVIVGGANSGPNAVCGQSAPGAGVDMAILGYLSTPTSCTDGYTLRPEPDPFDEYVTGLARRGNNLYVSGVSYDEEIFFNTDELYEASFLARFSSGLDPVWGRGNSLYDGSRVSAPPANDSVVIAGWFGGGAGNFFDVDADDTDTFTAQSEDLVFAKYDVNGNLLFVRHVVAALDQRILAVTHLSDGRIVIAGSFEDSVVFGANPDTGLPVSHPTAISTDGFITVYDPEGAPLWTLRVSGAGDQQVTGLAVLPGDRLVAVGNYTQGATVGGVDLASSGGADMFVLRIATEAE